VLKNDKMQISCFERTGMLLTLPSVVVPEGGADLVYDDHDDNFENDSQCEWDDDVDDIRWEQDCGETFNKQQDVIIEDENNDEI
jgi:hypothetical protein